MFVVKRDRRSETVESEAALRRTELERADEDEDEDEDEEEDVVVIVG